MWSGYSGHATVMKKLLAAPGIDINVKDNVSEVIFSKFSI